jgi:hypothetical protein
MRTYVLEWGLTKGKCPSKRGKSKQRHMQGEDSHVNMRQRWKLGSHEPKNAKNYW